MNDIEHKEFESLILMCVGNTDFNKDTTEEVVAEVLVPAIKALDDFIEAADDYSIGFRGGYSKKYNSYLYWGIAGVIMRRWLCKKLSIEMEEKLLFNADCYNQPSLVRFDLGFDANKKKQVEKRQLELLSEFCDVANRYGLSHYTRNAITRARIV